VWMGLVRWLPSHRTHVVSYYPSFIVLGVAFLAFDGVGLLGFLGVRFVIRALVHEGLAASKG